MALEKIINSLKNTGKMLGKASAKAGLCALLYFGMPAGEAKAADIYVTNNYPTIQQAINAAGSNDTIHIGAGKYNENLSISNKFVDLVGNDSNPSNTVIYYNYGTNFTPVVKITGPGRVKLSNLELNGGYYSLGNFVDESRKGVVSSNAVDLTLDNVILNQFYNYFVESYDGNLTATNVSLCTRPWVSACDVGFALKGCKANINNLKQEKGMIDHTVDVNNYADSDQKNHSEVVVENSTIRASTLNYGDCIRTYTDSDLTVKNCNLYRPAGGTPAGGAHTGVGINGYSNNVNIASNTFDGVPRAICAFGSIPDSNKIVVENNQIKNCENTGIKFVGVNYQSIDLGGGSLGSRGGNSFSHTNPPAGYYDVLYTNQATCSDSTANIFALGNTWTGGIGTNKEQYIYDKLDNPIFGRLITENLGAKSADIDGSGKPVLSWNERGAGEKYYVYENDNLMNSTNWNLVSPTNQWPMTNSSLTADNIWTNTYDSGTNSAKFYKIKSIVP